MKLLILIAILVVIAIVVIVVVVALKKINRGAQYVGCFTPGTAGEDAFSPVAKIHGSYQSLDDVFTAAKANSTKPRYVAVIRQGDGPGWWVVLFNNNPPTQYLADDRSCHVELDLTRPCGCTNEKNQECPRGRVWAVYDLGMS